MALTNLLCRLHLLVLVLLWGPLEVDTLFGLFWPFLLVRPVSAKTATFWLRSHQNARLTAQRDGT